jgi:hypothetical protein
MKRGMLFSLAVLAWSAISLGQSAAGVPAGSPLRISQVSPAQIVAGDEATLKISGQGFANGAYVSFSNPGLRVISTRRQSASSLQAKVQAGALAEPGEVTLYVSNPDGASARAAFTILGAASTPASSSAPAAGELRTTAAGSPIVSSIKPSKAAPGSRLKVQVAGKNFAKGVRVAFSNPAILVVGTDFIKSSQLSASVRVAANAAAGPGSLFVVNPDGTEAEVPFTVSGSAAAASSERFDVLNLGDAVSFLQSGGKARGVLIVSGNKLEYDEGAKKVFAVTASQVQEIAPNQFFGINTGTFHIILTSGKTYNFTAASLLPSATQAILNSLQKVFQSPPP